ncbi:hypothetical protein ACVQD4_001469 [Citrobacter freundii]
MGFETLIGIAAAVIAAIAGAFGLGHIRGSSKAEAKADQQRTEDNQHCCTGLSGTASLWTPADRRSDYFCRNLCRRSAVDN